MHLHRRTSDFAELDIMWDITNAQHANTICQWQSKTTRSSFCCTASTASAALESVTTVAAGACPACDCAGGVIVDGAATLTGGVVLSQVAESNEKEAHQPKGPAAVFARLSSLLYELKQAANKLRGR